MTDWITWSGGENPEPGEGVEMRRRDGREFYKRANALDWLHSPRRNDPSDIVAYRVVKP